MKTTLSSVLTATTRVQRIARTLFVGGLAACLFAALEIAGAPDAAAATPTCTTKVYVNSADRYALEIPATSSGSQNCQLASGNSNYAVKVLQHTLQLCYQVDLGKYGIDGKFGPATVAGLKKAQSEEKKAGRYTGVVDGVYGKLSRNALRFAVPIGTQGFTPCRTPAKI